MKFKKILIGTFCLILIYSTGYKLHAQPIIPYIEKNGCPFECCKYGTWVAKSDLKVYEHEGGSSEVIYTIKPGEKFTAVRGNVHIVKLGLLIVKKPFNLKTKINNAIFNKDDKIYILSYGGEGYYDLWYKGKILDIDLDASDLIWENSQLIQKPHMIWWVLVKNKEGEQGWLQLKNISQSGFKTREKIKGLDACESN